MYGHRFPDLTRARLLAVLESHFDVSYEQGPGDDFFFFRGTFEHGPAFWDHELIHTMQIDALCCDLQIEMIDLYLAADGKSGRDEEE